MFVHHIALRTAEPEALAEFYQAHFGLTRTKADTRSIWLALSPRGVLMIERREAGEPAVPQGALELLAFALPEADHVALRARLLHDGRLEAETTHTLYFRDPDGRRVASSTHPLGLEPTRPPGIPGLRG